jgi:endonuclease-3 related protein
MPSRRIYGALLEAYGPQGWWPGESDAEVCVGAVLTQNTSWKNVEAALSNLRSEGVLHDLGAIERCPLPRLAEWVRPAGFASRKAPTLKRLAAYLNRSCRGEPSRLAERGRATARRELLAIRGIGPETADAILLYAARIPVFVSDAYARRVAERHGLVRPPATYDTGIYNEYHALLVRVGKERCRRTDPLCEGCPLEPLLPEVGQATKGDSDD